MRAAASSVALRPPARQALDCPGAGIAQRDKRRAGRARRLRWLALILAGVAAVIVDGGSPRAWAYLERCAAADSFAALAGMAWRLDAHLQAFPATAVAMLALCLLAPGSHAARGLGRLACRAVLMLVAMVPVCLVAWWLASGLPGGVQAYGFAAAMLVLPLAWPVAARRHPGQMR